MYRVCAILGHSVGSMEYYWLYTQEKSGKVVAQWRRFRPAGTLYPDLITACEYLVMGIVSLPPETYNCVSIIKDE